MGGTDFTTSKVHGKSYQERIPQRSEPYPVIQRKQEQEPLSWPRAFPHLMVLLPAAQMKTIQSHFF